MLGESENQFSFTRGASSTCYRPKKQIPININNLDFSFEAHNNLFRGDYVMLWPNPTASGLDWTITDNLFDTVSFASLTDNTQPLDHGYNAYWLTDPLPDFQGGTSSGHDQLLSASPPYEAGPLGNRYLPSSSPLYHAGSRTPADAGLYHYTTETSQAKEGATSGHNISIGLHYIATTSSATTQPNDYDNDGIPDYIENASGDGIYANHIGVETDWQNRQTTSGIADAANVLYDQIDLDGDGLPGWAERLLGTQPLLPDSPLAIGTFSAALSGTCQIPVTISTSIQTQIDDLTLISSGYPFGGPPTFRPAAGSDPLDPATGSFISWNTSYENNGVHLICLKLTSNDTNEIYGPMSAVNINNRVYFPEEIEAFGSSLNVMAYTDPNAPCIINLADANGNPITYNFNGTQKQMALSGTADATGLLNIDWDLTFPDGTAFSGETVVGNFLVSSSPAGTKAWHHEWGWGDGKLVLARVQECPGDDASLQAQAGAVIDAIGDNLNQDYYELAPQYQVGSDYGESRFVAPGAGIWPKTANHVFVLTIGSKPDLITALQQDDSRNFLWFGHAGPHGIGYGDPKSYVNCPQVEVNRTKLVTKELRSQILHNTRRFSFHPYRFVFICGCYSANGDLSTAFGIPREVSYLTDWQRRKVPARAFIGTTSDAGPQVQPDTEAKEAEQFAKTLRVLYKHWQVGDQLDFCLSKAKSDYDPSDQYDEAVSTIFGPLRTGLGPSFVIYGAQDLTRR